MIFNKEQYKAVPKSCWSLLRENHLYHGDKITLPLIVVIFIVGVLIVGNILSEQSQLVVITYKIASLE